MYFGGSELQLLDEEVFSDAHAPVDVEQKLFRVVRISESDQEEYTLETLELLSKEKMGDNLLNVLWKAHFIDRHVSQALGELLQNDDAGLSLRFNPAGSKGCGRFSVGA
jgi:hypothetical protein